MGVKLRYEIGKGLEVRESLYVDDTVFVAEWRANHQRIISEYGKWCD